ncbi:MAG TPA: aldo/keto reductase [Thermomicrobiales bacterium]|nr:aldo/keto reductase [Thermomicrobiales bacterium]
MQNNPTITLNNGIEMPQLGYGVWQIPDEEAAQAVGTALAAGYRSIDTAAVYGNEEGVGRGIAESGIAREDLFITTKLWNEKQGYDSTLKAFDRSLHELKLDYVDLYLIHWPLPARDLYIETWRAFEKLYADGLIKAIGVSNFLPEHLDRLLAASDVVPAVNQIELHPYLQQSALRTYDREHGIATEAWSPLAKGNELLQDPVLTSLGERHGKSPAQIVLRWHIQLGNIVIPKSVTPARIRENMEIFDFELSPEEMAQIATLNTNTRTGGDPAVVN